MLVHSRVVFLLPSLIFEEGKVQKEELDFWRAAGEGRPEMAEKGAGRSHQGVSLPREKRVLIAWVRPPNVELW